MEMTRLCAIILALVAFGYCHTFLSEISINGAKQGQDKCIRPQLDNPSGAPPVYRDSPVSDVSVFPNGLLGANMTCGFLPWSGQAANAKCPVQAGDTIGLQYWHDHPGDDVLDPSHSGPIIIYLAKSETGAGNVWFKIYQDGYNSATQTWASNKMINNVGVVNFTIPTGIAPGNYLMRTEIIALHEGFEMNGAQAYVHCVELTISSSGTDNPSGVAFPGAYSKTDPGILFDIYNGKSNNAKYVIPGPAIYTGKASSTPTPVTSTSSSTSSTSSTTTSGRSSTTTTGRSSTTTTTGRASTATTGRSSTTTTTGRSSTTTTGQSSTSTSTTTGASSSCTPAVAGSCTVFGNMVCVGSDAYQTCSHGSNGGNAWSAVQYCPTNRRCTPAGDFIYCL